MYRHCLGKNTAVQKFPSLKESAAELGHVLIWTSSSAAWSYCRQFHGDLFSRVISRDGSDHNVESESRKWESSGYLKENYFFPNPMCKKMRDPDHGSENVK